MGEDTLTEGTTSQLVLSGCELTGYTLSEIVKLLPIHLFPLLKDKPKQIRTPLPPPKVKQMGLLSK